MAEIVYKQESYAIMGACFEVYNEKGCGFLEPVYQECLLIEFEHQRIPAVAKPMLTLSYRNQVLTQFYAPDFICFEKIVLELKSASSLVDAHRAQVLNYSNATGFDLGLLVISDITRSSNTNVSRRRKSRSHQGSTSQMSLFNIRVYSRHSRAES
jgi:GxxExxY protein